MPRSQPWQCSRQGMSAVCGGVMPNAVHRAEEERRALRPLHVDALPEYDEAVVRVSREALVRVGRQAYSVPARFAGERLRVRGDETELEFWWNGTRVARTERLHELHGVGADGADDHDHQGDQHVGHAGRIGLPAGHDAEGRGEGVIEPPDRPGPASSPRR